MGARGRPTGTGASGEDVYVRNFDAHETHRVRVRLVDGGGTAFERQYRLRPGEVVRDRGVLRPGEYDVEVELDGLRRRAGRFEAGATPGRAVVVQAGDGVVSVTEDPPA